MIHPSEENSNEIIFYVPIGSDKTPYLINFHPYSPAIKYLLHDKNTRVFSVLASDFFDARENISEKATAS